jgi:hypothetical protein
LRGRSGPELAVELNVTGMLMVVVMLVMLVFLVFLAVWFVGIHRGIVGAQKFSKILEPNGDSGIVDTWWNRSKPFGSSCGQSARSRHSPGQRRIVTHS